MRHLLSKSDLEGSTARNSMGGARSLLDVGLRILQYCVWVAGSGRTELDRVNLVCDTPPKCLVFLYALTGWPISPDAWMSPPPSQTKSLYLQVYYQYERHTPSAVEYKDPEKRFGEVERIFKFAERYSTEDWTRVWLSLREIPIDQFYERSANLKKLTRDLIGNMSSKKTSFLLTRLEQGNMDINVSRRAPQTMVFRSYGANASSGSSITPSRVPDASKKGKEGGKKGVDDAKGKEKGDEKKRARHENPVKRSSSSRPTLALKDRKPLLAIKDEKRAVGRCDTDEDSDEDSDEAIKALQAQIEALKQKKLKKPKETRAKGSPGNKRNPGKKEFTKKKESMKQKEDMSQEESMTAKKVMKQKNGSRKNAKQKKEGKEDKTEKKAAHKNPKRPMSDSESKEPESEQASEKSDVDDEEEPQEELSEDEDASQELGDADNQSSGESHREEEDKDEPDETSNNSILVESSIDESMNGSENLEDYVENDEYGNSGSDGSFDDSFIASDSSDKDDDQEESNSAFAINGADGSVESEQEKEGAAGSKKKKTLKGMDSNTARKRCESKMLAPNKPAKKVKAKAKAAAATPKLKKRLSASLDETPLKSQRIATMGNDGEDTRKGKGDTAKKP